MPKSRKKNGKHRAKRARPPSPMQAPRNPLAQHPLMRRGGTHQTSRSSERSASRRELRNVARDWHSIFSVLALKF